MTLIKCCCNPYVNYRYTFVIQRYPYIPFISSVGITSDTVEKKIKNHIRKSDDINLFCNLQKQT